MKIQNIITELTSLGFSQGELAEKTGLSQATISRLGSGKHSDTSYAKAKILEQLLEEAKAGQAA